MPVILPYPGWLLAASLSASTVPPADAVELPWSEYQRLRDLAEPKPGPAGVGAPVATERVAELSPVKDGWMLRVRWTLDTSEPAWMWRRLLGPTAQLRTATLDGRPLPVVPLPDGSMVAAWVEGPSTLEATAFVPGDPDSAVHLQLMEAVRGRLAARVPDRLPEAIATGGQSVAPPLLLGGWLWTGAEAVAFRMRDPDRVAPPRKTLAVAHAGVGLTVGDGELRGRAHLQWEIRHGELEQVRASIRDLGDDLVVEGPLVSSWRKSGDTLEVDLSAPAQGRVDLQLSWTRSVPAGDESSLPIPRIEPDAWRTESSLQVARDGELEVIPQATGWTAVAASALPDWGRGLVEGTPAAAYQRSQAGDPGSLDLLRFVPVSGPPTVVDVATYTMATTREGRVLMRARYDLRNDRGANLTVVPPPGLTIVGARVASKTALPSRTPEGAWRIPLARSLETVEGLLSFPVEVILLGEQDEWDRREQRELTLPTLDAPIAASHVTVYLPPQYSSRLEVGERNVVDDFSRGEGLTYGHAAGDKEAQADALFQEAVEGYLSNDFDGAQGKLAELEQLGVDNKNMARLQSNLDLIEGKDEAKQEQDAGEVALRRRVKEQAKARAIEQFAEQEELIAQAASSASAGNYEEAEIQYKQALDIGDTLAKLEQTESVEQQVVNQSVATKLKAVGRKKKGKKARDRRSRRRNRRELDSVSASSGEYRGNETTSIDASRAVSPAEKPSEITADQTTVYDFADDEIDGELLTPDGAALDARTLEDAPPEEPAPPPPAAPGGAEGFDFEIVDEELDAPVPEPEPDPEPEPERPAPTLDAVATTAGAITLQRRSGRGRRGIRRRDRTKSRRGLFGGKSGKSAGPRKADRDADNVPDAPDDGGGLPAPKVTASALAVIIPTIGEAVRYEQLLLEADQTQTITIDARRSLRRRP